MFLACAGGPEDSAAPTPEAVVDVTAEIEGLSVGTFVDGFAISTGSEGRSLAVYLTTYPDPCETLTGFYLDLGDWALAHPDNTWSQREQEEGRVAAEWFPDEPYDTLRVGYAAGDDGLVATAYEVTDGEYYPSNLSMRMDIGRVGYGTYNVVEAVSGHAALAAPDPAAGDGEGRVKRLGPHEGEFPGNVTFTFEVPACDTWLPAHDRYLDAQPTGP